MRPNAVRARQPAAMNSLPRRALLLLLPALFLPAAPCALAIDKVAVTVQVHGAPHKDDKKNDAKESQGRVLDIALSNQSRENLTNLKVKWIFFGFDLKDDEVVVSDAGTLKCSLPPNGTANLSSKAVEFDYTRKHAEKVGVNPNRLKPTQAKAKSVAASGTRYAGWAVQVYQVDGVIGEAFSRPDLKDKL
jgi:hypothetical protein